MIAGFSTNAAQLTKALQAPKGTAQPSVVLDPAADQTLDAMIGNMADLGAPADAIANMQQFQADLTAFQTDQRVGMTLDAMQELARYLSAVPGRKNLIWFSGSFPLNLDPDPSLQNPSEVMRDYYDDVRETSELLSAARVAVYPVDARGLMNLPSAQASYTPSTNIMPSSGAGRKGGASVVNNPSVSKDNMKFMQQLAAEHASMQQVAEDTGGEAFLNTNGMKEAVASAVDNGANYYTISYVPPPLRQNGEFHKVQVRGDTGGWQLAYRRGYYEDAPDKASHHSPGKPNMLTSATLHGAPPATQILFQARVLPATDPLLKDAQLPPGPAGEMSASLKGQPHRYIVDLLVDAHTLTSDLTPEDLHQSAVEVALIAYDAESKQVNYVDRAFMLKLKPEQYTSTMTTGIHLRFALDLPAGQNSLRIAVHDLAARRVGSLEVPLAVKNL